MLTVHHLGVSQSERVIWLCEEIGLPYRMVRHERREDNKLAPEALKTIHPMGLAPVIEDDGRILGESAAICQYIDARYNDGALTPQPDDPDYADFLYWFHFANGTLMPNMYMETVVVLADLEEPPFFFVDRKRRSWSMLEKRLGEAPFFAGERLTLADIMIVFVMTTGRMFINFDLDACPNARAYLRRIGERPAYRAAMAKAEPGFRPMLD
ncbi:glutathione S-transferase family protein [Croceicoccus sp. YJ47]|uniref:glutathione S-transferase family protein n=1 Tax=Croceicoccus sp. YJ47 TaxID=2798724 RepID=UPI0019239369|nr:glutathione S-transferase family protein [Croceicoccus sp. YJ47]QQN73672.1 glutathione S-transferase family protein [Croceicoccus sp. YJ47]